MEKVLVKVVCPRHHAPLIYRHTKVTGKKGKVIKIHVYTCPECNHKHEINESK